MTEITRVPLQPIAKGTLTKLWAGVLAVALAAAGLAWFSLPPGVKVVTVKAGSGAYPGPEDVVFIKYVGKLAADGKEFDRSPDKPLLPVPGLLPEGVPMLVSGVVPGFSEGLQKMQKGGKYTLRIPAEKGYGATPPPESPIPPNADLVFDVELLSFTNPPPKPVLPVAERTCDQTTTSGLGYRIIKPGTGKAPTAADIALVDFTTFDAKTGVVMEKREWEKIPLGQATPAFGEALKLMQIGASFTFCLPKAAGAAASPDINIRADLLDVRPAPAV